jgi:hypothetical protein
MENFKKFIEALKTDAALREKVSAADKTGTPGISEEERRGLFERDLLPLIKEAGFNISMDEYDEFRQLQSPPMGELSDEQMDSVAGGWTIDRYSESCMHKYEPDNKCDGLIRCDHLAFVYKPGGGKAVPRCEHGGFNTWIPVKHY